VISTRFVNASLRPVASRPGAPVISPPEGVLRTDAALLTALGTVAHGSPTGRRALPGPPRAPRGWGCRSISLTDRLRSRWRGFPTTLWFVPDELAAVRLVAEGIPRGQVWTVAELQVLLRMPNLTAVGARRVAVAKLEFDGVITDVRRPAPAVTPEASSGWLPGVGGDRDPDA
jgi:hypothetical protein